MLRCHLSSPPRALYPHTDELWPEIPVRKAGNVLCSDVGGVCRRLGVDLEVLHMRCQHWNPQVMGTFRESGDKWDLRGLRGASQRRRSRQEPLCPDTSTALRAGTAEL